MNIVDNLTNKMLDEWRSVALPIYKRTKKKYKVASIIA